MNKFNRDNLISASESACIPLSRLMYLENKEIEIEKILWMWSNQTISSMEEAEGFVFGWGKNKPVEEVSEILKKKYNAPFLISLNTDPVIIFDEVRLFDGWKRAILTYSMGISVIQCSLFKVLVAKPYIYLTDTSIFDEARIKLIDLNFKEEFLNEGLLFHFDSEEDKTRAKLILNLA